jgi:hypothetical protein
VLIAACLHRSDLAHDFDTVPVPVDHVLDTASLALNALQAPDDIGPLLMWQVGQRWH